MKKYLTFFFALFGLVTVAYGQTFKTFTDNFDSYTTGAWLAQTSSVWNSWSGTPSTSGDDVKVSNADAFSGSRSLYFSAGPGPEDIVLPFGGVHKRGQFVYTSMMKIPKGKSAYFNFQADATVGVTWALEVYLNTDSTMVCSNLSSGTLFQTTYPQGDWFELKMYINLTKNEWHVFIDNNYLGNFSNSINRVSHLNIYPATTDDSYYMDDVSFTYAPASPNNAGVEDLSSPTLAVCGKNDVKVRVVNNGSNALDSVRVNWMLNGIKQKPVFVKTKLDTTNSTKGNWMDVTLDSVLNLKKGSHTLKVWTSYPNGVVDTLNFDDTMRYTLKAEVRGVNIDYGFPFMGKKGRGTAAWPDTVCAGDTIAYTLTPPAGYTNADLGTGWKINYLNMKSNGKPPVDTQTFVPKGKLNYRLKYKADTSEGNSIFKIEVSVSIGIAGCDTILTHYFFVEPQPDVAFTTAEECLGDLMNFTNNSKGPSTTSYLWKFGDNTSSKFKNTSKLYKSAGTFDVTLKATAETGCTFTVGQTVRVHDIPVSKFSVVNACDTSAVQFIDSSFVNGGTLKRYFWEFGDGDTTNVQNPTHIYPMLGIYKAKLTVTSSIGCTNRSNGQVEVYAIPTASFSSMNSCQPDSVDFTNSSSYTGTDSLSYEWNFGDGNTSTMTNPRHLFGSSGNYTVQVKVSSAMGCMDSILAPLEIYALPTPDFSMDNSCLGEKTIFINKSSSSNGKITAHSWNFGNDKSSTTESPVHKYKTTGIFEVQVIVTDTMGCTDSTTNSVEVLPAPVADFTLTDVCQGTEASFVDQSTTTSDTLNYNWNFGDDNTSTAKSPKNVFTQDGTYSVKLLIETENGCIDSIENSIEIFPLPDAVFTFSDEGKRKIAFTPDDPDLLGYHWDFGDGDTSIDATTEHIYATEGDYDVRLRTISDQGCTSETTNTVTVIIIGTPEGNLSVSPFDVYPNPFNDQINVVYELQKPSTVSLEIYNLDGKLLSNLVNQKQSNGKYQYNFNPSVQSGTYLLKMIIDDNVFHQMIIKGQ